MILHIIKQMLKSFFRTITFFYLVSSIVWPALSYCDDFETRDHQTIQKMEDGSPVKHDIDRDCDHCCHMSSHLLGFMIDNHDDPLIHSEQPIIFAYLQYPPGYFPPLLRPPSV